MTDGPGLNLAELRRQLTDLADSVEAEEPWDDPLPPVLRAAAMAEPDSEPRPGPGRFTVVRGRGAKIGWPRVNPVPLVSVAAAFLVIALIGVLLHGGGSDSNKASSGAGGTAAAQAAGGQQAGSQSAAATAVPGATSVPGTGARATQCATLTASTRVMLDAPTELVQGSVLRVKVTTSRGLRLTSPTILVRSGLDVIGRLVPTVAASSPATSGSGASLVLTGRLVRTPRSCGDLPGNTVPRQVSPVAASLPAGRYQLVVTGSTAAGRVASAPIAITVHR